MIGIKLNFFLQNQHTRVLFPTKSDCIRLGKRPDLGPARDSGACNKKRFQPPIIISKTKTKTKEKKIKISLLDWQ